MLSRDLAQESYIFPSHKDKGWKYGHQGIPTQFLIHFKVRLNKSDIITITSACIFTLWVFYFLAPLTRSGTNEDRKEKCQNINDWQNSLLGEIFLFYVHCFKKEHIVK